MENEISVHDNVLVSYEVNCEQRSICLHTQFRDRGEPFELTDVLFTGVVAYHFEHDSQIGTVLFDIENVAAIEIYRENADSFRAGMPYGWPGEWAATEDSASVFFRENGIHGFMVASSCGLSGWVLATHESRQLCTSPNQAEQSGEPAPPITRILRS